MSYGLPEWREWVLPEKASRPFFERALEHGINFFDPADMYSLGTTSEEVLGRAIRDLTQRHKVVIGTKVFYPMSDNPNDRGLSRQHILDSIDASLRRLGIDDVDFFQIHRLDPSTPIEETLRVLDDIVRGGKARYIGASSMFACQFAKALAIADCRGWTRFVSMQNHYNLIYREEEREMLPLCRAEGIGVIPWSPLARGFLAGNRQGPERGATHRAKTDTYAHDMYYAASDFAVADRVVEMAKERAVLPAQIALAWVLHGASPTGNHGRTANCFARFLCHPRGACTRSDRTRIFVGSGTTTGFRRPASGTSTRTGRGRTARKFTPA